MTRWVPEKSDTLRELATEILHNYSHGRALVAVDGPDRVAAADFADELARSIVDAGHDGVRGSVLAFDDGRSIDEERLRAELIEPFRSGEGDAVMVVDAALADRPGLGGLWNYAVWLSNEPGDRGSEARARATAVIDTRDADHPRRVYDDAC